MAAPKVRTLTTLRDYYRIVDLYSPRSNEWYYYTFGINLQFVPTPKRLV